MNESKPGVSGAAVTPSDTAANEFRWLWIGGAGDGTLKVTTKEGSVISFAGVPVGVFPVSVRLVWDTGTGVTNIVGMN